MTYVTLLLKLMFTLFIIIDPIGYSLIFYIITKDYQKKDCIVISYRAIIYAFIIILFYLFIGKYLIILIHVSMSAMKITGGLSLLNSARMIMVNDRTSYDIMKTIKNDYNLIDEDGDGEDDDEEQPNNENNKDTNFDVAIYPLATGILAGPGTLTTIIILSDDLNDTLSYLIMILSVSIIYLSCFLGTLISHHMKKINSEIINVINMTIGLLLCSLSVTFITDGLKEISTN